MDAIEQLWQAYQSWKELTQREGAAIRGSNWSEVHSVQKRKRSLQAEIIRLTDKAKATCPEEGFDAHLRSIVNELIALETQNNLILQTCVDSAADEKQRLDTASSQLRRVHSRYVPSREPAWENLS